MYLHTSNQSKKVPFNLRQSIETVLTIYSNQLKQGVEVNFDIPNDLELMGFEEEINQVWTNVIVNACQAMNFNGQLSISCEKTTEIVRISIADTGNGISNELGDKIFDAFFSTKKIGEGSGLGLDIVKKIITRHGGKIYYSSRIGSGTTFYIELPLNETT